MKIFRNTLALTILIIIILISNQVHAEVTVEKKAKTEDIHKKEQIQKEMDKLISKNIPMDLDHQKYLFNLCKSRDLDYVKILAFVKLESGFNPNNTNGVNFGYMQIGKINHPGLMKKTKTENKPLDPYVNLNWGTRMLSDLYTKYANMGYTGDDLDNAVWSAYNKGCGGFQRTGLADSFIRRIRADIGWINNRLNLNE